MSVTDESKEEFWLFGYGNSPSQTYLLENNEKLIVEEDR